MEFENIKEIFSNHLMNEEEMFYNDINMSLFGIPRIPFEIGFNEDHLGIHKDSQWNDLDDFLYNQLDNLIEDAEKIIMSKHPLQELKQQKEIIYYA